MQPSLAHVVKMLQMRRTSIIDTCFVVDAKKSWYAKRESETTRPQKPKTQAVKRVR
jgi:hypothetical protein